MFAFVSVKSGGIKGHLLDCAGDYSFGEWRGDCLELSVG